MKKAILVFEPKHNAYRVIRAAAKRGYRVIVIVSDLRSLLGVPRIYGRILNRINEVVCVGPWDDFRPDRAFIDRLGRFGPIVGCYTNREEPLLAVAKIRNLLGLPTPTADIEQLAIILNKFEWRKKLVRNGLSNLEPIIGREADGWTEWGFDGEAIFKPICGGGSRCVTSCTSLVDRDRARREWRNSDRNFNPVYHRYLHRVDDYFLEPKVQGELLSIEGWTVNGRYHVLGLTSRILYSNDSTVEMGCVFPYPHPQFDRIVTFARDVHHDFGWVDGFTHLELIVKPCSETDALGDSANYPFEAIDFNPRFIGAEVHRCISKAFDYPIEEMLLDSAIGEPSTLPLPTAPKYSALQYILPPPGLKRLRHLELPHDPDVMFRMQLVPAGTRLRSWTQQGDWIGAYMVVADSYDQALIRSHELRSSIRINRTLDGAY